ncbi:NADH-quinone oxidoreductase subunit 5 family protein [Bowmanella dokdonensis]|uniref:NADH:quinone oxidoreductase/Mrp antiporter transmembrane domain-containing protein n=1 Tax=Bowmanella dokdonensis TaxID=751969 RepID=A0A939DKL2_9ALTE|nr:proton-conducting transporter membrane subunit [Bowmanella dokdonensis]MBN7824285.1 hypothetical protein [Bowmanella dokdonensis]
MLWSIPAIALLGAPLLFWFGRRWQRIWLATFTGGICIVMFMLAWYGLQAGWQGTYSWNQTLTLQLDLTPLTALFVLTIAATAAPVVIFTAYHETRHGLPRLHSLLLFFTGAMTMLVLAADLLSLLIAWELVGACSWALISHQWRDKHKVQQAGWAFLVTRLGDLGLFVAVFSALAATGSLSYGALSELGGGLLHLFAAGLVLAAATKSAQVPFSPWLFCAMAGPVPVSALLHAATMVAAGTFILIRLYDILAPVPWFEPVVLGLGLCTALAAGLVACAQGHAKKLLAASTSAHYGFMWVAIGGGYPAVATLHFVVHAALKAALFLVTGVVAKSAGSYRLEKMGKAEQRSLLAVISLVSVLALAGLFPLGAAWTKEKIVTVAGHVTPLVALSTMLAGALCAIYAARFHLHLFGTLGRPLKGRGPAYRASVAEFAPLCFLALCTVLLSLLWLPSAGQTLEEWLKAPLPPFKAWELILSTILVVAGGLLGCRLTGRQSTVDPALGRFFAGWWSLPVLGHLLVVKPVRISSQLLSRAEQQFAALGMGAVGAISHHLARLDQRAVDKATMLSARLTRYLAKLNARAGEWLFNGIPTGMAALCDKCATRVQSLQTGLSHQYYTLAVVGVISFILVLITGEMF